MAESPIRLTLHDDLVRSRLTVFFRLLLAIPHLVWISMWGTAAYLAVIVNWFATLFVAKSPDGLHRFLGAYLRYSIHVRAYLLLAANPYPAFLGQPGTYPVDLEIDPPERQNRWKVGFRAILLLPAFMLLAILSSVGGFRMGLAPVSAFLGWFAALFTGRAPRGLRDAAVYSLRYSAEFGGYMFVLTDRYPGASPTDPPIPSVAQDHPIVLSVEDDLRRSRLLVFFRFALVVPHLVWLQLWSILALLAGVANWFATLATGRSPAPLRRFLSAFLRYSIHVYAFFWLTANPFPGFVGKPGSYPVDVEIAPGERQNRWRTGFRFLLALPALLVAGALNYLLTIAGLFGWFVALFTGGMPKGLRDAGAYALRYTAQTYGYLYLLTDRYPHASPGLDAPPGPPAGLPPTPTAGVEPAPEGSPARSEPVPP
ncbi:MAG: DUF4389 domain-containing protein [Thermoleophilaceae bacterium]